MTREVHFNKEARDKLMTGVDKVANAVKCTLGPKGRNVVIENAHGTPNVTKDGVTVAKHIKLKDPVENLGADIIKQASAKTGDLAGDGTTTSTVIAQALIKEGTKLIENGANPIDIKRSMEQGLTQVVSHIRDNSIDIKSDDTKLTEVAIISANNDVEMGSLIASTFAEIGEDGVITVENSKTTNTYSTKLDGLQYDKGWISPYFVTDHIKRVAELENPYILVTDKKIRTDEEIFEIMKLVAKEGRPLLIIADSVELAALNMLVQNKMMGKLQSCATTSPWYGSYRKAIMEDIATVVGATYVTKDVGLSTNNIDLNHLGEADKVIVGQNETTIIGAKGKKEEIDKKLEEIKGRLDNPSNSDFDVEKLKDRYAKLSGGVAVIHVGAATEVELREKKDRVDDAICATRAALKEGIVPGGGTIYNNAVSSCTCPVLSKALRSPYETILNNAGVNIPLWDALVGSAKHKEKDNSNIGYNANTSKVEDLVASGVIDPAMVSRLAVEHAVSVASAILMSECTLSYEEVPNFLPPDPRQR